MDPANLITSGIGDGWKDRIVRGYRTNPGLCQTGAPRAMPRESLFTGDSSPGLGVLLPDRHESLDQQDPVRPRYPLVGQIRRHQIGIAYYQLPRHPGDSEGD